MPPIDPAPVLRHACRRHVRSVWAFYMVSYRQDSENSKPSWQEIAQA